MCLSRLRPATRLSESDGTVDPVRLRRVELEPAVEASLHLAVRVRRQETDDATVMAPARVAPLAQNVWKVVRVVRDHYSLLLLSDGKQDRVVELPQLVDAAGRGDVQAAVGEDAHQAATREVGRRATGDALTARHRRLLRPGSG